MGQGQAAFLSYARSDDQNTEGWITEFRQRLSREVHVRFGQEFLIFQDIENISWGQPWQQEIEEALDSVRFLIPIMTPSFFRSDRCRDEVTRFLVQEQRLGRNDLILPVYYVSAVEIDGPVLRAQDPISAALRARQFADWRELRYEPWSSPNARREVGRLAARLTESLRRAAGSISAASPPEESLKVGDAMAQPSWGEPARQGSPSPKQEPPTHVVDTGGGGDHSTIRAAIDAAGAGDRILVRPGRYQEHLFIDKALELIGDGEASDITVQARGHDVITFRATMGRIVNLTVRQLGPEGNWYGVDILQGRLVLENCDISSRSGACVAIRNGANPTLRGNLIHDGAREGVYICDNSLGTLEDNDISRNRSAGVMIRSGANPVLRGNQIHDGATAGVYVCDNSLGTLEDNDVSRNGHPGLVITGAGNPAMRRNRIHNGRSAGVYVFERGLGTLEDNEISHNALAGVEIATCGNPTVRGNTIHHGRQAGIHVYDRGKGIFEENEVYENALSGVEIAAGGQPTLRKNKIVRNGAHAIKVHDGGHGVVTDNDLSGNEKGAWDVPSDRSRYTVQSAENIE